MTSGRRTGLAENGARREAVPGPVRMPMSRRTKQRWAIAGGVVVGWLVADNLTGSFLGATVLLIVVAGLGVATVVGLRAMGITRDHPALQRLASRPWRDGQDVLRVALQHLPEVFIVTPNGSLIAPDVVELQMNPADLRSLRDLMGLDVVSESATQVYEHQVAKRGARFAGSVRPEVYVVPEGTLPKGRFRLQRGVPVMSRPPVDLWDEPEEFESGGYQLEPEPAPAPAPVGRQFTRVDQEYAHPVEKPAGKPVAAGSASRTRYDGDPSRTRMDGLATVMEQVRPKIPTLRLVTGLKVAETIMSGARAGRGPVELALPEVPTVSRVHAIFTFDAERWCWSVANQGANGMSVNGTLVTDKCALSDGDSIRWGQSKDAPLSRVEIG